MTNSIVSYSAENRIRRKRRMQSMALIAFWVLILLAITLLCSTAAHAQMNNKQWSFTPQNRASIAALMRQAEDGNSGALQAAESNVETLVCGGGGGSSSATANSTCIILNNSTAGLNVGQDSQGDQGANNQAPGDSESIADDLLEALGEQ